MKLLNQALKLVQVVVYESMKVVTTKRLMDKLCHSVVLTVQLLSNDNTENFIFLIVRATGKIELGDNVENCTYCLSMIV